MVWPFTRKSSAKRIKNKEKIKENYIIISNSEVITLSPEAMLRFDIENAGDILLINVIRVMLKIPNIRTELEKAGIRIERRQAVLDRNYRMHSFGEE